jgi:hypothetical protein
MTAWTITLFDGRTAQIEAHEITTRPDGSLWALRSVAPPDKLAPVAIFARDMWSSCYPCDAAIVRHESQRPTSSRFA